MKYLLLLFVLSSVYAAEDAFGDLLGQDLHPLTIVHIRERRQAQQQHQQTEQINYRPLSQAPTRIQQLLQSQLARDPIVHLPPQPPPNLGPARPIEPQYVNQAQISAYRPEIKVGNAPQQPTYKNIPVAPAQYRSPAGAQQQYNPQYRGGGAQYPQQGGYRQIPGPQQGPQPQYSKQLPPHLQQLLQVQANLPNSIPKGQARY